MHPWWSIQLWLQILALVLSEQEEEYAPHSELMLSEKNKGAQLAFVVRIEEGCTGTLIHPNWMITAHHCITNMEDLMKEDKNGDLVAILDENTEIYLSKPVGGTKVNKEALWRAPMKFKINNSNESWRKVQKIILYPKFAGEALSWQGHDIALLKLNAEASYEIDGHIVPICLPLKRPEAPAELESLFAVGYGRRTVPHCVTNMDGPEKFGICGRPVDCTKEHRARECGLSFLYEGKIRTQCLKEETPSAQDPVCKKMLLSMKRTSVKHTTYVFSADSSRLVTTCYPTKPSKKSKGWCTVREPTTDEDKEPTYDKGWGFCSEDHDQITCNSVVIDEIDLKAFPVSQLTNKYCIDQLMENLAREQPDVTREEVEPFTKQFCTGRNHSVIRSSDRFVQITPSGKFRPAKVSRRMLQVLLNKDSQHLRAIDGGPICFGDSGGPIFSMIGNVPVLQGVFSYMLWGTCRGKHEPSYYGTVRDYLSWIYRHVPEDEVCKVGENGKIVY